MIKLFAKDCIIYWKIINNSDIDMLQIDLDRLGECGIENTMKLNPGKSKAVSFTTAPLKNPPKFFFGGDQRIPKASSCRYLGIILHRDLCWADQVNYTVQKAWKALHFIMCVLNMGNGNMKSLAYTLLVRQILEKGVSCWDPYKQDQIIALDRVQKKAAKFASHVKVSVWEILA